jgi:uncharacterized protein (DUF1810 family)
VHTTTDPYDLARFERAQADTYEHALSELREGRKQTHWMWFIFPQFDGLGFSETARYYAVKTLPEARAYLAHPVLGPRLEECAEAILRVEGRSAHDILGSPDDLKLRSSATLFSLVSAKGSSFDQVLDKYFDGRRDDRTLQLVAQAEQRH